MSDYPRTPAPAEAWARAIEARARAYADLCATGARGHGASPALVEMVHSSVAHGFEQGALDALIENCPELDMDAIVAAMKPSV